MRWSLLGFALIACKGGGGSDSSSTAPPLDFANVVRPMLADNCARCHGVSGLGAGLNFTDYDTVKQWAEVMIDRIDSGTMPPPLADPDCHPYEDDDLAKVDPTLSDTLQAWIDAGMPEGDMDHAPEIHVRTPKELTRQDLVLKTAAPMAPHFVDGNEYRCFLIDDDVPEDTWIAGVQFLSDHPQIAHHALLFVDPDGGSERYITEQASKSWTCPSVFPDPGWMQLHAWAPSGGAVEFPDGMGIKVTAHSQIILQMHYYQGTDKTLKDQPGYAFKLEDSASRELFYLPFGPDNFRIPAGDPSYTATENLPMSYLYGLSFDLFGVMPHMHFLGSGYDFHVDNADGSQTCIARSEDYDFSTQPTYWFQTPITIPGTSTLSVSCTWDNSESNPHQTNDPPVDVTWGENTQQEMCFALMYASLHG